MKNNLKEDQHTLYINGKKVETAKEEPEVVAGSESRVIYHSEATFLLRIVKLREEVNEKQADRLK